MQKISFRSLVAASLMAWCAAVSVPSLGAEELVTLNFVNADIPSVVKAIGGASGKNFIFDPRVTGTMNIVSDKPVTRELAYQILLAALRVQGYAAIEGNGYIKIIPEADAKTTGSNVEDKTSNIGGDRIVTRVFALQNESAAQLVAVLRPLVSANNFIGAYPGNNTLVITDYAENVRRIARIIASIDIPTSAEIQVVQLRYASAVDVGNLLTRLMPEAAVNPQAPGVPPKLAIGIDPRTNSLLLRADSPALVARVKTLVAGMDIPTASNGNINVVPLRNAEAVKLAETLRALLAADGGRGAAQPASPATAAIGVVQGATSSTATAAPVSTIQAYAATNSLVIIAPDYVYNSLRSVIDKLDQRRAQIFVEALIVEVSTSIATEFGIQWQDLTGLNRSGANVIGGTNFGSRGQGLNIIDGAQGIAL